MKKFNFETKKKNIELIVYQKQSVNVLKFITDKFLYVFAEPNAKKWGFDNRNPQTMVDVNGDINTSTDYYINYRPLMPVGMIMQYAGSVLPEGWLFCNGTTYNNTEYVRLYNIIGITYGGNEEDGTYQVPNFGGKVPIGTTGGYTISSTGGSVNHTLAIGELPSHQHTGTTNADGVHTHTHNANGSNLGLAYMNGNGTPGTIDNSNNGEINCTDTGALSINNSSSHTHTFTTDNTGSNNAFSIMQPYIVINYIIRC